MAGAGGRNARAAGRAHGLFRREHLLVRAWHQPASRKEAASGSDRGLGLATLPTYLLCCSYSATKRNASVELAMSQKNTLSGIHRHVMINDGCWIWAGTKSKRARTRKPSYGTFQIANKTLSAHRLVYHWFFDKNPGCKSVCHTCDNPLCVRPSHLFLGTHAENMRDMVLKGRAQSKKGEAHHAAILTASDVIAIRSLNKTQVDIARIYNVTQATISLILSRKTWHHL